MARRRRAALPLPGAGRGAGRVEQGGGNGDEDGDDDDRADRYAFRLEIEASDATVEHVVAHLGRFPVAAGWSGGEGGETADDAEASFAFVRACGGGCEVTVRLDVFEPERRNRGPRLEVVVTFTGG